MYHVWHLAKFGVSSILIHPVCTHQVPHCSSHWPYKGHTQGTSVGHFIYGTSIGHQDFEFDQIHFTSWLKIGKITVHSSFGERARLAGKAPFALGPGGGAGAAVLAPGAAGGAPPKP